MNSDDIRDVRNGEETAQENAEEVSAESEKDQKNDKPDKKYKKENEKLKTDLESAQKELEEQKEKYLRLAAEYDNFRRRSQKEKEQAYSESYSDAVTLLLPVIDNMEMAKKYEDGEKLSEGVKLILTQFSDVLEKMGIKEIETKTFDPNLHNAVMHVEDENYGEGEIVEVFRKGYIRGDKVIRYAMVKVAN